MKRGSLLVDLPRPDPSQPATRASWYTPGLSDGLGDRLLMFDNTTASGLELLRFRQEFSDAPTFAPALERRVEQLRDLSHKSLSTIRAVEWLGDGEGLALVSNSTPGKRLSEVLHDARGASYAMALLHQLGPALAALHKAGDDVAHGALTADRIIVTPEGQLVLVEHVLGSALDSLSLPAARLRTELGIVVPYHLDTMALDSRSDVAQLAFVALSLLLGRRLDPADYPDRADEWLELAAAGASGLRAAPRLRAWLECALQVGKNNFESALEAHEVLEEVLDIHKPRTAAPLAEPAAPPATAALVEEGEPAMGEQLRRTDPGTRRTAALVEFRPEVKASPDDETVEVPRLLPAAPLPDPREVRRSRRLVWIAAALGVLALAEAVFIAGLIFGRPVTTDAPVVLAAAPTLSQPTAPPAAAPAPDSGVPNLTPPANAGFATIAPGSTSLAGAVPQGRLEISSDPAGARVSIDGVRRGVTPLAVPVAVGPHTVVVSDGTTAATRTLTVAAGGTSTMIATLGPAGGAAGWLTIGAPVELQILEGESLLGTTTAARLMLPAGTHELQLVNKDVGFQTKITVDVQPGKTANTTVAMPNGSLSVNALPWANVWLDGRALGTTPVANLDVPLGTHEVIWRHPQFGERRQTVVVTTKAPVRLVMDLRK